MGYVAVVDYGVGNLKSVQRGLEKIGASVKLSADPEAIMAADRLVLPGVGAFKDGMQGLQNAGVIDALNVFVQQGKPLLGICLGMQMLLECSEEHGVHDGLGYIPGVVKKIPQNAEGNRKIPYIGWSALHYSSSREDWGNTPLDGVVMGDYCYFVHSYMAMPKEEDNLLAQYEYDGTTITAAINKDNVTGLQFHPEKSGAVGLKILDSFLNGKA